MAALSKWLLRGAPIARPACRLICFPYAGGSAAIYRGWQAALPASVEVLAVELPGHGARFAERPVASLRALVDLLIEDIAACMDVSCVFFGHSNGALISYVLATELARRGLALPQRIVISAKRPPHLDKQEIVHAMPTADFVDKLRALNGTPAHVLSNPELLELFLPILRADFSLSETYEHVACPPLPCEVTLLGGRADSDASASVLGEWAGYFATAPTLHLLDGDHFFVHSARNQVLRILRPLLADCVAVDPLAAARY